MHELSLCEGILKVLEDQATEQDYARVKTVWLEIGALAAVEVEAMRFSFDLVCRDSLAEGCRLEILPLPGTAWCMQCADSVEITADRHAVVELSYTDDLGLPLDRAGLQTPGAVSFSFMLA